METTYKWPETVTKGKHERAWALAQTATGVNPATATTAQLQALIARQLEIMAVLD